MVTVGMTYDVLQGRGPQFESAFRDVRSAITDLNGHRSSYLFRDVDDPHRYLVVSEWYSREALDRFVQSERFRSVAHWGRQQILAAPPRHEVFTTNTPAFSGTAER